MWKNNKRHGEGVMSFKDKCVSKLRFNEGKIEAVLSYDFEKGCCWADD